MFTYGCLSLNEALLSPVGLFELTPEQSFLHQRVLRDAKKLDKDDLLKVMEDLHRLYLIKGGLFTRMVNWCARTGVELPSFNELYGDAPVLETNPDVV